MASFLAKIGCQRPQKRENKNYRSVPLRSNPMQKTKPQKNSKKFKKLKSSPMASFQAKIGWKSPRKSDSKNYRSVPLLPDAQQKIPKKQQKNSKN